ncbi:MULTISPECIES: polyprenyl diphosphate synthase [Actinoalloteichus]|uniref:Isoprenyl transferase n=1 Tax=Actinoalloteichus fjordicus TaxID=1612552 RepID=A0AAC9LDB6_9PSEU|nr:MULTISPECIES: polyprenyl diphosphate synthase [Actinoalloteichus]APU15763.1 Undecaprenyl pyrophosphate synthetase [Actinoalloteichus fjordicus]APU21823.1 Undecaprenyl pyrophosphate synthetase [Actinoalloteichus sp. GBA129-24]
MSLPAVPAPGPGRHLPPPAHSSGARAPRIPPHRLPRHVAIIMDGNGRWAAGLGAARTRGHRSGSRAMIDVVDGALEVGLAQLSLYAFSTENWGRPAAEVDGIMLLLHEVLRSNLRRWHEQGIRVLWSGRRTRAAAGIRTELEAAEYLTRDNELLTVAVCFDYGSRAELLDAVRLLAVDVATGRVEPVALQEEDLAGYLYQPDMSEIDLLVRTGGEQRISNFLLWQAAYAELIFEQTLWPDFDRRDLWRAVQAYTRRQRRFGGSGAGDPGVTAAG